MHDRLTMGCKIFHQTQWLPLLQTQGSVAYGSPIPQELLAHMFEPLRRGEQQVKLGSRSVGLGL